MMAFFYRYGIVTSMYSGERILPRKIFNVTYQQSLVAYEFAMRYAAGHSVLDVASGEGYGTSLLGATAAQVIGIDYNQRAVAHAQSKYSSSTVSFVHSNLFNAFNVLHGATFDVVCCFQTLEHVMDHDRFLKALSSVTKPGGTIIVSTPNKDIFPSFNPYHVHELGYQEMQDLFVRHFNNVQLYGVLGDDTVLSYRTSKQKIGDAILKIDFLKLRTLLPQPFIRALYAFVSLFIIKQVSMWKHYDQVVRLTAANFHVSSQNVTTALDFIAVAKKYDV